MTVLQTETTDMKAWQKPEWSITSYNFPPSAMMIKPPASWTELKDWEPQDLILTGEFELAEPSSALGQDAEDLQDGLGTELIYRTRGIAAFSPYRDYRERKLRQQR